MPNCSLTNLKISSLEVQNYRCLKDISIVFNDPVTVLIGRNAVGKSTIIDVFEFVLDAIVDVKAAINKRGASIKDITWGGQEGAGITLRFSFDVPDDMRSGILTKLGEPTPYLKKPTQVVPGQTINPKINLFQLKKSYFLRQLVYEVTLGSVFRETIFCSGYEQTSDKQSLLVVSGPGMVMVRMAMDAKVWQLESKSSTDLFLGENNHVANIDPSQMVNLFSQQDNQPEPTNLAKGTISLLRNYFSTIYHGSPHRKPTFSLAVTDNRSIDAEGTKLVQVLHTLHNNDRRTFQKIESDLKSLVDEIEFIGTPIVETNKTTLDFHQEMEGIGDVSFDLKQMSSGTAQLLILLTQIHASPVNTLILLEEIESMLHPSAQAQLIRILNSVSNEKTFVLSTHSPVIASQAKADSLVLVKKCRGVTTVYHYSDTLAGEIVAEMGIRPSFSFEFDRVISVEGEYDEAVYRN